ncbi:hypothetical protein JCM10914A_43930 [Paenibacillus sp. JCM 10914]|uniref:hypothetical protein n=1 Tax=Paenibacillus sp. JCM 10914 TaxID=1236974 RepID=UPI0003CC5DC6|nr:hypothetical protein [Paenibacillus sp. JCM 10914]GAE07417.1 hypothetical protein JCM10914_3645 [Paenibacillus sp. JCM 10914]
MRSRQNNQKWTTILRKLDLITAILILNGQVTITGVFLQTGGAFSIPVGGPITGGYRIESRSKSQAGNATIDLIDILLVIFLLCDAINVQGTYITSGRFSIVLGGPLFGGDKTEMKDVRSYSRDFKKFFSSRDKRG